MQLLIIIPDVADIRNRPVLYAAFSIESCLQALLQQDYPSGEYEIIAVDNNSTDDSALRVQRFERVRLVRESRQGSYAARNAAAIQSTGEILTFTDADCIPASDWLMAIDRRMREKSVQAMMASRVYPLERMRAIESYENARVARKFCYVKAARYWLFQQRKTKTDDGNSCLTAYLLNISVH